MPAIETEGLTKRFDGGIDAVVDLNMEVGQGEIFAFLGPNGAGKSTTVRMLTTLLKPSGGSARIAQLDLATQGNRIRRVIGVALQEAALDPLMTGVELMQLQGALHDLPAVGAGTERQHELLEVVGLADAADRQVATYSAGMRRRLDFALALLHRPTVLFLDEPTTGLDPESRLTIWERVRELKESGTAVFLTTHYLEEADELADRVMIIDKGSVVAQGTPRELKASYGTPRLDVTAGKGSDSAAAILARFGDVLPGHNGTVSVNLRSGAPDIASIVRAFDDADVVIQTLDLKGPTLEDVFIAKTGRRLEPATNGHGNWEGHDAQAPS